MTLKTTPKIRTPNATILNVADFVDGEFLKRVGDTITSDAVAGGGDVSAAANIADLAAVVGDGGVKGVKASGVRIGDLASNNVDVYVPGVGAGKATAITITAGDHSNGTGGVLNLIGGDGAGAASSGGTVTVAGGAGTLAGGTVYIRGGTGAANGNVVIGDTNTAQIQLGAALVTVTMPGGSLDFGHASDTTITRPSAGNLAIEGNIIYRAGGTDVPITDGGTGASTAQAAIDALTQVAGATNEHVLTKDTATGNAIWKAAPGGGSFPTLFKCLSAAANASNVNTAQPWFPSAGAVTLTVNKTYRFRGLLIVNEGTTSHSVGFSLGGTATITGSANMVGCKRTNGQAGTTPQQARRTTSLSTNTVVTAANTTGGVVLEVFGVIRCTGAGTLIPRFQFSAAPGGTPQVQQETYFELVELGDNTITELGTWA
jgi:hypothetical protein